GHGCPVHEPQRDLRGDPRWASAFGQAWPQPPDLSVGSSRLRGAPGARSERRLMTARRSRGEGSLHWNESRQRWIAEVTVGYDGRGKRITRKASTKTKTEAKAKLKEMVRNLDDGLSIAPHNYTVADAVQNWLDFGLSGDAPATIAKCRSLAHAHII